MKFPNVPSIYSSDRLSGCYLTGYGRGWNCASWQDIPAIGSKLPRHIDWEGVGPIQDAHDQADALSALAFDAESHDRDFSPFEFTAKELNDREDSEDAWEAFEQGIADGISANVAQRINPNL